MWIEVITSLFKVLSWHLPVGTEENKEKCVRIAGLQAKILAWNLLNMK
jgi:hypothetical protein